MKNILLTLLSVLTFLTCQERQKISVINLDDQNEIALINSLDLDKKYQNLLNPNYTAESEYTAVLESWSAFHKAIGQFIDAESFKWNVPDSSIVVMNRIYFDKNGRVDYFLFKVHNKNVSDTKKMEYQELLNKYINELAVNLKRDEQFAQCGKVNYIN